MHIETSLTNLIKWGGEGEKIRFHEMEVKRACGDKNSCEDRKLTDGGRRKRGERQRDRETRDKRRVMSDERRVTSDE
jgi:hypothetical protein